MKKQKQLQKTFFGEEVRLESLREYNNPLSKLDKHINWEIFRKILEKAFAKEGKDNRGRPHYDYVMMFKIIILQTIYQLSDEQLEFQIMDRLSFMSFLGLSLEDKRVPDSRTIWHFRNVLIEKGKIKNLFNKFKKELKKNKLLVNEGVIVDASIIESQKTNNTRDERDFIKELERPPQEWSNGKKRQKDIDAKWTKKRNKSYFGYKNHIKIDKNTKFILTNKVTPANTHDSVVLKDLISEEDGGKGLWGDSAYSSREIRLSLKKKNITDNISKKGSGRRKLNEEEKHNNKVLSKVRVRVEHVFACMKYNLSMRKLRCIGLKRAEGVIELMNLTYNIKRFIFYKEQMA